MKTSPRRDLLTLIFAHKRFHEVEYAITGTLQQREKREWYTKLLQWVCAIVFTPLLVGLWIYLDKTYGSRGCIPFGYIVLFFPIIIISTSSCCLLFTRFFVSKPSWGRWIITSKGIYHQFGHETDRFVPFSSIRSVKVEKRKTFYAGIVFETDNGPLRIPERSIDYRNTRFLPFLNLLLEQLQCSGSTVDVTPLTDFQLLLQKRKIERRHIQKVDWLLVLCFALPPFGVLPFYPWIHKLPYPIILWYCAACASFVLITTLLLFRILTRWKNKKIDAILESVKRERMKSC